MMASFGVGSAGARPHDQETGKGGSVDVDSGGSTAIPGVDRGEQRISHKGPINSMDDDLPDHESIKNRTRFNATRTHQGPGHWHVGDRVPRLQSKTPEMDASFLLSGVRERQGAPHLSAAMIARIASPRRSVMTMAPAAIASTLAAESSSTSGSRHCDSAMNSGRRIGHLRPGE